MTTLSVSKPFLYPSWLESIYLTGLSQPATSNALARLRSLFKDDLFIKTSKGMTPTPRAVELADPIRQALLQIQSTITSEPQFIR